MQWAGGQTDGPRKNYLSPIKIWCNRTCLYGPARCATAHAILLFLLSRVFSLHVELGFPFFRVWLALDVYLNIFFSFLLFFLILFVLFSSFFSFSLFLITFSFHFHSFLSSFSVIVYKKLIPWWIFLFHSDYF